MILRITYCLQGKQKCELRYVKMAIFCTCGSNNWTWTSCLRILTKSLAIPQQLYKPASRGLSAISELLVLAIYRTSDLTNFQNAVALSLYRLKTSSSHYSFSVVPWKSGRCVTYLPSRDMGAINRVGNEFLSDLGRRITQTTNEKCDGAFNENGSSDICCFRGVILSPYNCS